MSAAVFDSTSRTTRRDVAASPAALWTGRILTAIAILFLTFDAVVKLAGAKEAVEGTVQLGRAEVDATVKKAIAAGGSSEDQPEDHGFMYEWSFSDPDGHGWGVFWMDPAAVQG